MDAAFAIAILARWIHILAAVTLAGGTFFTVLILLPAAKETLRDDEHARLRERITARWRLVVMVSAALLLASGFYNFFTVSLPKAKDSALYHPLFGIKFLAALAVFFLASVLTGKSPTFEPLRRKASTWIRYTALLGLLVILLSGVLKNLPAAS